MKKSIVISLILLIICSIATTIYAAETKLVLTGDNKTEAGKTGTMYVKVSSDESIGSITFTVTKSDNVSSIKCTSENGWTITPNESISKYNAYKATGAKDENIMKIEYTLKENAEGTAKIEVTQITAATIEGDEVENIANVSKTITIKADAPDDGNKDNNVPDNNVPENNIPENNNTAKDNTQNSNSSTTANKTINYTGLENYTFAIIAVVASVAVIAYIKYKQYKNV